MRHRKILLADNDPVFLASCSEYLEAFGYEVVKAANPVEARNLLETVHVHLAILDLRLNNDDEKDRSGLFIAKEFDLSTPKIILTKFPAHEDVRDAMRFDRRRLPPAVDFVNKKDDLSVLLDAVNQALALHVSMNWDLAIEWKESEAFGLVNRIEPNLEGALLLNRAEEFEDLLRQLFNDKDQIRVERLFWEKDSRVALIVFTFKESVKAEAFMVVCGQNTVVNQEAKQFQEFSPDAPGETGTTLNRQAETTHFAANAYAFANNDLEKAETLIDLYRLGPEKVFNAALSSLCLETLRAWHQDKPVIEKAAPANASYRERLRLADIDVQQLDEQMRVVESRIPILDARILRDNGIFSVHFKHQTFTHADPIPILSEMIEEEQSNLFITVPGELSGHNILVDEMGRTWLTDFAEAGLAPVLWNYVTMEAMIRFDWIETRELQRRYELEHCLVHTDFVKPDIRELEPAVRKPARAIQAVRKLAARAVGKDIVAYQQGVFLHAIRRLADINPAHPLTTTELARLGQILFSTAMIAEVLGQSKTNPVLESPSRPDRIRVLDDRARIVLVGNRQERLTPQTFALFKYLFDKANQLCSRDELLKEVLQDKYDEGYLHTLVRRIRKVIEDDPQQPRFLVSVPNAGYRLITRPK